MILRLILAVMVFLLVSYAIRYYRKQTPLQQKKLLWRYGLGAVAIVLLGLIATGRVHWLSGLFAAFFVFLQRSLPFALRLFPFAHQWWRQRSAQTVGGGNKSTVQSDYLRMVLDHDSADMDGDILKGKFAGRKLSQCSKEELIELLDWYASNDEDSFNLLQAYLQRTFGGEFESASGHRDDTSNRGGTDPSQLTEHEALEVLGLESDATDEEIIAAHKKLMQKLHPDRGGSNYLAAKVNQAKDFLLKKNRQ